MIRIEHTHAEGTIVAGTARGDGTNLVIKATGDGWRFSRHVGAGGAWYLPRSRDRNGDTARIERLAAALRASGHQVEVDVDDTPRPTAEVEADRAERVEGRVERYSELAQARHASGSARLAAVDEARARIPLGQPILSARDANYRRRLHQREDSARAELAAGAHWQQRTQAAEVTQAYRHNPRATLRRIERLEADRAGWQRRLDALRVADPHGQAARVEQALAALDDQLRFWRERLAELENAGAWAPWLPEHFRPGDEALILRTWYPVVRVNRKSLTVTPLVLLGHRRQDGHGRDTWTDTTPYDKVYGRRRNANTLHTPPPPTGARCTTVRAGGDEAVGEGAVCCAAVAVARLIVRHDGDTCGCEQSCVDEPGQEWAEVALLCADHTPDPADPLPAGHLLELLT